MGERIKMNSKQQNGNENKIAVLFVANQRSYCWRWQIGEAKCLNWQIGKKLERGGDGEEHEGASRQRWGGRGRGRGDIARCNYRAIQLKKSFKKF